MSLHTCPNGHLTAFRSCPVCKREDYKQAKRKLTAIRRENRELTQEIKELRRQINNLTGVIAAGRAF